MKSFHALCCALIALIFVSGCTESPQESIKTTMPTTTYPSSVASSTTTTSQPPTSDTSPATTLPSPIKSPRPAPEPVDETGLGLKIPDGYKIAYFTRTNLGPLRFMAFSPDGILFVTKPTTSDLYSEDKSGGEVFALPDKNGDGEADDAKKVIANLGNRPHGIAFHNGYVYIAEENEVSRYKYNGNGEVGSREGVVALPAGNEHVSRTIMFGPSGKMYISVGSSCNVCKESRRENAAILEFYPDGSNQKVFAEGLRNAVGFIFHSATGDVWATENGRDHLGEDLPPDEINIVKEGKHYGWPYCYGTNVADPAFNDANFCQAAEPSSWDIQAHSAALGLRFIEGPQFKDWEGDLLVAFHGSWNRQVPTGYKVVKLDVKDNKIVGEEDFITGWLKPDGSKAGRPVDVIFDSKGSLYISDDKRGVIYKMTKIEEASSAKSLSLTSPAFTHNGSVPSKYTCDGQEISPPLQIGGVPEGAKSLVLLMDDPDAADLVGYPWDHWVVFNIEPSTTSIAEGQKLGTLGVTSGGEKKYEGSCPPKPREHSYSFRLYALDKTLAVPEGSKKTEVEQAMQSHIMAQAELTGRYRRV